MALIALDATTSKPAASTSPVTGAHTTSGTNRILFVGASNLTSADPLATATFNGVAMNLVAKKKGTAAWSYLFALVNPTLSSWNISVSWTNSGGDFLGWVAASYTGAAQNLQPEVSSSNSVVSASSITDTLTTLSDNSWTIIFARAEGGGTLSGGTGTTKRISGDINEVIGDSNGVIHPAGSTSLQISSTAGGAWSDIMASFAPATSANLSRTLLGVGS